MSVDVERRPNGTYRVRIRQPNAAGKWVVVKEVGTFPSEKEAQAEKRAALKLLRAGKLGTLTSTPTLGAELDLYERKLIAEKKPSAYHVKLARPHLEALLDVEVGEITRDMVRGWIDACSAKGVGRWAIIRALTCARAATMRLRSTDNPWVKQRPPKPHKRKVRVYTPDEARALLAHMNEGFCDFFALDLLTGARPSELAAMGCDDIDLAARQWTIKRSLTRDIPKDGDERTVPLSAAAIAILKPLIADARERGPEESDIYSDTWIPVWPTLVRNQARNSNLAVIVQRAARAAAAAGDAPTLCLGWDLKCRWCKSVERVDKKPKGDVKCARCDRLLWPVVITPRVIWYSLRHTSVTLLDDAGVSTKVIGQIVGHASVAFTESTYIHRAAERMREAMDTVSLNPKRKKKARS